MDGWRTGKASPPRSGPRSKMRSSPRGGTSGSGDGWSDPRGGSTGPRPGCSGARPGCSGPRARRSPPRLPPRSAIECDCLAGSVPSGCQVGMPSLGCRTGWPAEGSRTSVTSGKPSPKSCVDASKALKQVRNGKVPLPGTYAEYPMCAHRVCGRAQKPGRGAGTCDNRRKMRPREPPRPCY
jgi:hypothetical protein